MSSAIDDIALAVVVTVIAIEVRDSITGVVGGEIDAAVVHLAQMIVAVEVVAGLRARIAVVVDTVIEKVVATIKGDTINNREEGETMMAIVKDEAVVVTKIAGERETTRNLATLDTLDSIGARIVEARAPAVIEAAVRTRLERKESD